jgi:putative intracellular protease/amidase
MSDTRRVLIVLTSVQMMSKTESTPSSFDSHDEREAQISTGWSLPTAAIPFALFKQAGYSVDICSIVGGPTTLDPTSLRHQSDPFCQQAFQDRSFERLTASTRPLSEYDPTHIQVLFFAGGAGCMMDFITASSISRVGRGVHEHGGIIAAVEHGVAALWNITLKDGHRLVEDGGRCTGSTNEEDLLGDRINYFPKHAEQQRTVEELMQSCGASYEKSSLYTPNVVVDHHRRVVTGQNEISTAGTVDAVIAMLADN